MKDDVLEHCVYFYDCHPHLQYASYRCRGNVIDTKQSFLILSR